MSHESSKPRDLQALSKYRPEVAFPLLTEEMVQRLRAYGTVEHVTADTQIFAVGLRQADMFVILKGTVQVFALDEDNKRTLVATQRAHEFTGELDLITSRHTVANGYAATDCVLLRVRHAELREVMAAEGDIANLILRAAIWRRIALIEESVSDIVLLGESKDARTIELQRFLTRNSQPHRLVKCTGRLSGEEDCGVNGGECNAFPAVVLADGTVLRRPSIAVLADALGITDAIQPESTYDVVIVGAGPSGLAAAVYGASEGLSILVVEGIAPGGQAGTSSRIENYLGFPSGVSGLELATCAQIQAHKFGARMVVSRNVVSLQQAHGWHRLELSDGTAVRCRAVVIATGAAYSTLALPRYDRFEHRGIHYAATGMEAKLCRNRELVVVGGGNSAGQAALFLSTSATRVHLVVRRDSLAATMSQYLIARIKSSSRITVHTETEVDFLDGNASLERVGLVNRRTEERQVYMVENMFVMIGARPNSAWLQNIIALDEKGFVLTGSTHGFEESPYATNVRGVYAVGDVRAGSVKRVASAAGEGSAVVTDIHRYLAEQAEKTNQLNSALDTFPSWTVNHNSGSAHSNACIS